jgi:hypothetical protein
LRDKVRKNEAETTVLGVGAKEREATGIPSMKSAMVGEEEG